MSRSILRRVRWWYPFSWGWESGGLNGEEGDGLIRVLEHVEPVTIFIDLEFGVVRIDELTIATHLEGQGNAGRIVPVDFVQHVVLGQPGDGHVLLAGIVRRFVVVAAAELKSQQGQESTAQQTAAIEIQSTNHEHCPSKVYHHL